MIKVLKSLASLVRAQQVRAVLVRSEESDKYVVLSTSNKPPGIGERHLIKWVCQTGLSSKVHRKNPIVDENGKEIAIAEDPSVTVPLLLENECYGVLQLQGKLGEEDFNEHDGHLVESSTSLFTRFILEMDWQHYSQEGFQKIIFSMHRLLFENLYLYKENLESNQLYGEIIRVSKLVNTTLDLQSLLEAIMSSAKLVLRTESSSLMLLDQETGELFFTIVTGGNSKSENKLLKQIRIPKGQGIAGFVAENITSLIVNEPANDPRWFKGADEKTNFVTRNILAVPLVVRNQVIGVLEVINAIARDNFNEKDLELLNSFSELSALAIYNRDLIDSLTNTNKELARKVDDLNSLYEVSKAMISTLQEDELFERVVDIISQVISVQRVFIALETTNLESLNLVSHYGIGEQGKTIVLAKENSLVGKCFSENRTINTNNLKQEYSQYSDTHDILKNNCILYPLAHKDGVYGVVGISEKKDNDDFNDDDMQLLSTIGGQIIKTIQNFRLVEEMLQKREYDKELEITSSIQKEILPSSKLNSTHVDLAVLSIPARLMGGDFYDYYALSEDEFTFTIADVSGKSLPASLFMAVTSSILRTVSREHPHPADVLRRSNELIFQDSDSGMFVTVFYCLYDAKKRLMRFASAGHNELFLYRKRTEEVEFYKTRGAPLGILSSEEYGEFQESEFKVEQDDVILLFTDGVTEAINEKKEEFGEERLIQLFKEIHDLSVQEIIHTVYQKVQEFSGEEPQFDDVTLMVIKAVDALQKKSHFDDFEKEFRLDVEQLIHVKNFIEETLTKWRVSNTTISDVILACDEAVTNIISYAYEGREQEKELDVFSVHLIINEHELRITIKDKGNPFNYNQVPKPDILKNLEGKRKGGFGVFLIRALMDSNNFFREGDYNYLVMTKKID